MEKNFRTALLALSFIILVRIDTATAAEQYQRQVNLADQQRMLAQRMTKELLFVTLDVNKGKNLVLLEKTRVLFDRVLRGLSDGDVSLGLPAVTDSETLVALSRAEALWSDYNLAVSDVTNSNEPTLDQIRQVAALDLALVKAMDTAVEIYERNAYGGKLYTVNARLINLAGRQRMLSQKITKEFLLIAYGINEEGARNNLVGTISLFEQVLTGLIHGDGNLRIPPAPTPEILHKLEVVSRVWQEFRTLVKPVAEGAAVEHQAVTRVARINKLLLKTVNATVFLYEGL